MSDNLGVMLFIGMGIGTLVFGAIVGYITIKVLEYKKKHHN
jgi:hypothetical protein